MQYRTVLSCVIIVPLYHALSPFKTVSLAVSLQCVVDRVIIPYDCISAVQCSVFLRCDVTTREDMT